MEFFNSRAETDTRRSHRQAFRDIPRTETVGNDRSDFLVRRGIREYLSRSRKLRGAPLPTIEGLEARSVEWTTAERANRHANRFWRRKRKEYVRQTSSSVHDGDSHPYTPDDLIEASASESSLASLASERSEAQVLRFTENLADLISAERDRQAIHVKLEEAKRGYLLEEQEVIELCGDEKHIKKKKSHASEAGHQDAVLECDGHARRVARSLNLSNKMQKTLLKSMHGLEKQMSAAIKRLNDGERQMFTAARGFLRNLTRLDPNTTRSATLTFRHAIRRISDAGRILLTSRYEGIDVSSRPKKASIAIETNGDFTIDPIHRSWVNEQTYRSLLEQFYRTIEPIMENAGLVPPRETPLNHDMEGSRSGAERQAQKQDHLHELENALKALDEASNFLEFTLPASYSARRQKHFATYEYDARPRNSFDEEYLQLAREAADDVRAKKEAVFEIRNRLLENRIQDPYVSAKDLLGVRDELFGVRDDPMDGFTASEDSGFYRHRQCGAAELEPRIERWMEDARGVVFTKPSEPSEVASNMRSSARFSMARVHHDQTPYYLAKRWDAERVVIRQEAERERIAWYEKRGQAAPTSRR